MATRRLDEFSDTLLSLYRAASEQPLDAFQGVALSIVKGVLPFDSSMWGTATNTEAGIDIHSIHLHNSSQDMLDLYEEVKHQDTAVAMLSRTPRATLAFHSPSLFAGREHSGMRALCGKFGHANMLISANLLPDTGLVQWISLYRADADAHCGERERGLLELLAPHVMQALATNRITHLDALRSNRPGASEGVAIADAHGVLYHADADFEASMRGEWSGSDGRTLPPPLLEHFARESGPGSRPWRGETTVVRCWFDRGLMFLRARPRKPVDSLTEREYTIAKLLAQGGTHKHVARALNRSPATVRNQIQAIYQKLGVNNVVALAAELGID